MSKRKVLIIGEEYARTGFQRVVRNIFSRLVTSMPDYEFECFAINYYTGKNTAPYKIHPVYEDINKIPYDPYGFRTIKEFIESKKPDVIFILNDLPIIANYVRIIKGTSFYVEMKPKIVVYFPIDSPGVQPIWASAVNEVDVAVTYTNFAKREFEINGYLNAAKKIQIIPHGIDECFVEMEKEEALEAMLEIAPFEYREKLRNLYPKEGVIFFNGNRNTRRKNVFATVEAFAKFYYEAKLPKDAYLYMHSSLVDEGGNYMTYLNTLEKYYGVRLSKSFILTNPELDLQNPVSDKILCGIYNYVDINVNTCSAEGFGLIAAEMGKIGKPSILSACDVHYELFGYKTETEGAFFETYHPNEERFHQITNNLSKHYTVSVDKIAELMLHCYKNKDDVAKKGANAKALMSNPKYNWDNIANQFKTIIEN